MLDQYYRTYGFTGPLTESFDTRKNEILHLIHAFEREAPFTIQRISEVLTSHKSQYRSTYALMNALVRLLSVTSTVTHSTS